MGKIKSYLNKGSHKAWMIGIVVILVVLLFGHHIYTNGGLFTPKTQSFPEQLSKNKGTHVWFFTDDGKAKGSIIDYIMVTKNGKLTVYQIFSDNITLGKVSKMSNAQVIKLGKKQDKDYFKDATDEIKNAHNKVTYNGLMDDLSGDDQQEFRDKIVGGSTASLPKNITYRNVEDNSISLYMEELTGAKKEEMEASNASELRDAFNHEFSFGRL